MVLQERRPTTVAQGEVPDAFDEVADRYDLMVALNPGYHAHLRRSARVLAEDLVELSAAGQAHGRALRVVDLGCGSGASTAAVVSELTEHALTATVLGIDASAGMLAQARKKSWGPEVAFAHGRAEDVVPIVIEHGEALPLDGVFAAYLLRNVPDRDALLSTLYDVLAPSGSLVVHEYSVAGRPVSQAVWTAVCRGIVVPLGWVTSRRTRLYRYLWRSVMDMDSVDEVMARMVRAGFTDVRTRSVRGWQHGIIHTFHARRPAESA